MRNLSVVAIAFAFFLVVTARAQQLDAAFGVTTVTATSAANVSGNFSPQSIGGGAYPAFSADYLFKHNLGLGAEVAWRASQASYGGFQPYRPIFYDFNGIWVPQLGKRAAAEMMAGIGAETVRFYQPTFVCTFTGCTNFVSNNHFLGHVGGGIRLYVSEHFFIRPEAHVYFIHNNVEFSSGRATRYGMSIGYSFRSEQ